MTKKPQTEGRWQSAARRFASRFGALRARLTRSPSRKTQSVLLILAAAGFVVGAILSWQSLDLTLDELAWMPLVLVVVALVPLTIVVNAAEFLVIARSTGTSLTRAFAVKTVLVATAANLLPIPGSALVRVQALRARGVSYRRGSAATASAGVIWISVSLLIAAAGLSMAGKFLPAIVFLAGGLVAGAGGIALLRPASPDGALRNGTVAWVIAVEAALVATQLARMMFVLMAFDVDQVFEPALVLTVSSALAAAVGVFPGGLGISEAIAAGLSPLVALAPAVGFSVSAANRLAGLLIIAPAAALIGVRGFVRSRSAAEQDQEQL